MGSSIILTWAKPRASSPLTQVHSLYVPRYEILDVRNLDGFGRHLTFSFTEQGHSCMFTILTLPKHLEAWIRCSLCKRRFTKYLDAHDRFKFGLPFHCFFAHYSTCSIEGFLHPLWHDSLETIVLLKSTLRVMGSRWLLKEEIVMGWSTAHAIFNFIQLRNVGYQLINIYGFGVRCSRTKNRYKLHNCSQNTTIVLYLNGEQF